MLRAERACDRRTSTDTVLGRGVSRGGWRATLRCGFGRRWGRIDRLDDSRESSRARKKGKGRAGPWDLSGRRQGRHSWDRFVRRRPRHRESPARDGPSSRRRDIGLVDAQFSRRPPKEHALARLGRLGRRSRTRCAFPTQRCGRSGTTEKVGDCRAERGLRPTVRYRWPRPRGRAFANQTNRFRRGRRLISRLAWRGREGHDTEPILVDLNRRW